MSSNFWNNSGTSVAAVHISGLGESTPLTTDGSSASQQPPSYDDVSGVTPAYDTLPVTDIENQHSLIIEDVVEFEHAFESFQSHEELFTTVLRNPTAKTTVLGITRVALGPRRPNPATPVSFECSAMPLSASQYEIRAKTNPGVGLRSLAISMFDIPDNDPDIQFGVMTYKASESPPILNSIKFDKQYSIPPDVMTFLTHFSFKGGSNFRMNASAVDISQYGFQPSMQSRPISTGLLDATANWIALPKDRRRFHCGKFDCTAKASPSVSEFHGTVTYPRWKFTADNPPKLFLGLTGMNCACASPFRYSIAVVGESHEGFSWVVRNWDAGSINAWEGSFSWIAVADMRSNGNTQRSHAL